MSNNLQQSGNDILQYCLIICFHAIRLREYSIIYMMGPQAQITITSH